MVIFTAKYLNKHLTNLNNQYAGGFRGHVFNQPPPVFRDAFKIGLSHLNFHVLSGAA